MKYTMLLFNFTQWNTNNTQNEYKYLKAFILHKAGLTGINLQLSHVTHRLPKKITHIISLNITEFLE